MEHAAPLGVLQMLNCIYFPKAPQTVDICCSWWPFQTCFPPPHISTCAIVSWIKKKIHILKVKGVILGEDAWDRSQMLERQILADVMLRCGWLCSAKWGAQRRRFIVSDERGRTTAAAVRQTVEVTLSYVTSHSSWGLMMTMEPLDRNELRGVRPRCKRLQQMRLDA